MPPKNVDPVSAGTGSSKPIARERGCFQCSRRRIICDKSEPSCNKCIKKGIECSGPNRIRFTEGVARRGRLKDCKIPDVRTDGAKYLPTATAFPAVRWLNQKKQAKKRKVEDSEGSRTLGPSKQQDHVVELREESVASSSVVVCAGYRQRSYSPSTITASPRSWSASEHSGDDEKDVEEIIRADSVVHHRGNYQKLRAWIPQIDANTRKLFSYFSEKVAPVMVILDTDTNGYREYLLPMAIENDVLRRAIGVVAAQRLTREIPEMKNAAEAGRAKIISRLRTNSLVASADQVFDKFTWATLIVLLVGETVTAGTEYSFLVQLLLCLSANSKPIGEDSEVMRFLQTQTNMFELLSTPLSGEDSGVDAFQKSFRSWQDWLTCDRYAVGSENYRMLERIRMCFGAAGTIYIRRATSDNKSNSPVVFEDNMLQTLTIEDLIERITDIPPEAPGAHALVWPVFVAGAETSDPIHRKFFADYMRRIYARTQFLNVLAAVEHLETLWTLNSSQRWTQSLPEVSNVLII